MKAKLEHISQQIISKNVGTMLIIRMKKIHITLLMESYKFEYLERGF